MTAAQIITRPAAYLAERIQDAQNWAWSLEYELACLRDETWGWRDFYAGTVAMSGTEREMQDRAVAECTAWLEQAQADLAALTKQATAAMERQGRDGR